MSKIKVMGHVPPDTDSTCAPIVYSWYLNTHRNKNSEPVISGRMNNEATYVLNYFGVSAPRNIESFSEGDKVVLVDTNNPDELAKGYDKVEVIEIIDHHKLAGLRTINPVNITIRPYACTTTVIWDLMHEDARTSIPKDMAGLMLACIISDTLEFRSPTTTPYDVEVALRLAEISGVNIEELAFGMFAAKSDLSSMSINQILLTDHKDFEFSGKKYKLAVLETTDPVQALSKINELKAEMIKIKQENDLEGVFFFVIDILNQEAKLIVNTDQEKAIAEKAFGIAWEGDYLTLPGIVSRKKQIAPSIEKAVM